MNYSCDNRIENCRSSQKSEQENIIKYESVCPSGKPDLAQVERDKNEDYTGYCDNKGNWVCKAGNNFSKHQTNKITFLFVGRKTRVFIG